MDRDAWIAYYETAPVAVRSYLMSAQSRKNEDAAQFALAYDHDTWDRVMDIVWDVVFGGATRKEFEDRIRQVSGDRKPEDVEKQVLLHCVLPLADLVTWNVEGALENLSVPISEIRQVARISARPMSYGAATRRMATEARITLLSEDLVRRLREALVSYIKGARTVEQLKEVLQRAQAENGLGLTREQADQFVEVYEQTASVTQILSEEEYAKWLSQFEKQEDMRRAKPLVQADAQNEIAHAAILMPGAVREYESLLDKAVDALMIRINRPELEEYFQRRLRNLISTRLRDVRNALQVRELLMRDPKVGGMGWSEDEIEHVAGLIEEAYGAHRGPIEQEEKASIQQTMADQEKKVMERRQRESEERVKWYEEKVKATQSEQDEQRQALLALKGLVETTEQPTSEKPQIDGVVAPVRLTGLVEELGGFTLQEFRRLAKQPSQAAAKIKQKFESLQREGYERYTMGIQAWRNSPIQKQYLQLMTESFSVNMPVSELVEKKRQTDPSLPTAEELGIIIQLNSELQF